MAKGDFHERGSKIKGIALPCYEGVYIKYKNMEIFQNKCNIILIRRCSSV